MAEVARRAGGDHGALVADDAAEDRLPHPLDLLDQLKLAWRMRGLDVARVGELTRLMTMSAWDLLDDWFESPQIKGAMAVDGIIGTWAGPATPGTAYVLMHHEIGDAASASAPGDIRGEVWGPVSDALRSSAEEFGAEVRTNAPVERILQKDGRVTGVVLGGEELEADVVVAATHPRITFLEQLGRKSCLMTLLATSSGGTPAAVVKDQPRPLGATRLHRRPRPGSTSAGP